MPLTVMDERGFPPLVGPATFVYTPWFAWEIAVGHTPTVVTLRRLLSVTNQSGNQNVGQDVTKISFIPDAAWDLEANGRGGVTVAALASAARIGLSADQSVSASTNYQIPFNHWDLNPIPAGFSTASGGGIQVSQAGYYLFGLSVQGDFNSNPVAGDEISAEVVAASGTGVATKTCQILNATSLTSGSSAAIKLSVMGMDYFAANGSVKGFANASLCSVASTIRGGGTNGCYLWMARLFGS